MVISDSTLRSINKGFQHGFLAAVGKVIKDAEKLAMRTTSTQSAEVYGDIAFFPRMNKLIGEAIVKNLREVSYSIANEEWESTVRVKQADIERDALGIYKPRIATLGDTGSRLPSRLIIDALAGGFTAKDYTGTAFFAANKPHFVGGKVKFTNKDTKKLSAANYEAARKAMRSITDEEGEPMELGRELILVVSPKNESLGRTILVAEKVGGGDDNVNKGTATLMVSSRLAGASEDMWFLIDVGCPIGALILQEEKPLELLTTATGQTTEQLIITHTFLWQAYWRGNVGYGLPQLAFGSTGADNA